METVALRRRGSSVSTIARHTGPARKTICVWLAQGEQRRRARAPSVLEPHRGYIERRLADDLHRDATALLRELRPLAFARSYQTLTRELCRMGLRPECPVGKLGGHRLTLELAKTPWGAPPRCWWGRSRIPAASAPPSDGLHFAHLVGALDGVLRRLGGTTSSWRTDLIATLVEPGTDRAAARTRWSWPRTMA